MVLLQGTVKVFLKILYYCYVHTKLEYGSMIWSAVYEKHKETVEKMQQKFAKFVCFNMDRHCRCAQIHSKYVLTTRLLQMYFINSQYSVKFC